MKAREAEHPGREAASGRRDALALTQTAMLWGTPTSRDWKDGTAEACQNVPENGLLGRQAVNWRTPQAMDAERGTNGEWKPKPKAGEHSLRHQTSQWMTPRIVTGTYTRDRGDQENARLTLEGQTTLLSILPDRPISTVGEEHSHIRRTLNPLFVEWLMGWPRGWTSLALTPPASIGCGCSATALSRFRRRMRSALSQLGSHDAPPAQVSLFG